MVIPSRIFLDSLVRPDYRSRRHFAYRPFRRLSASRHVQHLRQMHRAPRRTEMANLRTAREPVGDDDRLWRRLFDRRNQNSRANRFRYLEMLAVVAERSRHSATSRVEHLELCAGRTTPGARRGMLGSEEQTSE